MSTYEQGVSAWILTTRELTQWLPESWQSHLPGPSEQEASKAGMPRMSPLLGELLELRCQVLCGRHRPDSLPVRNVAYGNCGGLPHPGYLHEHCQEAGDRDIISTFTALHLSASARLAFLFSGFASLYALDLSVS